MRVIIAFLAHVVVAKCDIGASLIQTAVDLTRQAYLGSMMILQNCDGREDDDALIPSLLQYEQSNLSPVNINVHCSNDFVWLEDTMHLLWWDSELQDNWLNDSSLFYVGKNYIMVPHNALSGVEQFRFDSNVFTYEINEPQLKLNVYEVYSTFRGPRVVNHLEEWDLELHRDSANREVAEIIIFLSLSKRYQLHVLICVHSSQKGTFLVNNNFSQVFPCSCRR